MPESVLEARVDWLTATATHEGKAKELLDYGLERINHYVSTGYSRRSWYWQGYRGTQCEHIAVGWRVDGCCIRMAGHVSGLDWRNAVALAGHVSRIDIAITVARGGAGRDTATRAYRNALAPRNGVGARSECTLLTSSRGGSTCYIGQRISHRFIRIYDKHAESNGAYPDGAWRYEIEYKGQLAAQTANTIYNSDDERGCIIQLIGLEVRRHQVETPWSYENNEGVLPTYTRDPVSNERRMAWLKESIAPAIEKLSASYSEEEILRALGVWYTPTRPVAVDEDRSGGRT